MSGGIIAAKPLWLKIWCMFFKKIWCKSDACFRAKLNIFGDNLVDHLIFLLGDRPWYIHVCYFYSEAFFIMWLPALIITAFLTLTFLYFYTQQHFVENCSATICQGLRGRVMSFFRHATGKPQHVDIWNRPHSSCTLFLCANFVWYDQMSLWIAIFKTMLDYVVHLRLALTNISGDWNVICLLLISLEAFF